MPFASTLKPQGLVHAEVVALHNNGAGADPQAVPERQGPAAERGRRAHAHRRPGQHEPVAGVPQRGRGGPQAAPDQPRGGVRLGRVQPPGAAAAAAAGGRLGGVAGRCSADARGRGGPARRVPHGDGVERALEAP